MIEWIVSSSVLIVLVLLLRRLAFLSKPTSAVEASAGPTACRLKSPEYANIAIFYYICIRIHTKEPCVSNRRNSSAG